MPEELMNVHSIPQQHKRRLIYVILSPNGKQGQQRQEKLAGAGCMNARRLGKTSHQAVILPELHSHGLPQLPPADGSPARAGEQGRGDHLADLRRQERLGAGGPAATPLL